MKSRDYTGRRIQGRLEITQIGQYKEDQRLYGQDNTRKIRDYTDRTIKED